MRAHLRRSPDRVDRRQYCRDAQPGEAIVPRSGEGVMGAISDSRPDSPTFDVNTTATAADDIELLVPEDDVGSPELSIVIPALNEQLTITEFVRWCQAGLQQAGIVGEILIIDSSTDETPRLALEAGARVLH